MSIVCIRVGSFTCYRDMELVLGLGSEFVRVYIYIYIYMDILSCWISLLRFSSSSSPSCAVCCSVYPGDLKLLSEGDSLDPYVFMDIAV